MPAGCWWPVHNPGTFVCVWGGDRESPVQLACWTGQIGLSWACCSAHEVGREWRSHWCQTLPSHAFSSAQMCTHTAHTYTEHTHRSRTYFENPLWRQRYLKISRRFFSFWKRGHAYVVSTLPFRVLVQGGWEGGRYIWFTSGLHFRAWSSPAANLPAFYSSVNCFHSCPS